MLVRMSLLSARQNRVLVGSGCSRDEDAVGTLCVFSFVSVPGLFPGVPSGHASLLRRSIRFVTK